MPSALDYTWFETTDLIVTAHIVLPCSAAPPLSQHSSFSQEKVFFCNQKEKETSKITHILFCRLSLLDVKMFLDSFPTPLPLLTQTNYHFQKHSALHIKK